MKRLIAAVVVLLALVPCARADDASKKRKIEELFKLTHLDARVAQMQDAALARAKALIAQMPAEASMTVDQKRATKEFYSEIVRLSTSSVTWETLKPQYVAAYAETYTEEDLDGALQFYKSPAGQKWVEKTPELTEQLIGIAAQADREFKPKFDELVRRYLSQMDGSVQTAPAAKSKR